MWLQAGLKVLLDFICKILLAAAFHSQLKQETISTFLIKKEPLENVLLT